MPTTTLLESLNTKGINRRLMKGVRQFQRSWGCVSGYFYLPDTEYFAVGFVADHKPSGGELLQFALPLYVQKFECHLSFAVRLPHPDGEFNAKGKSPGDMGKEFTSKAAPYLEQVRQRDSLPDFAFYVESLDALRNHRIRYVYALTLIMLERPQEAIEHLRIVANSDWEKRVVPDEARAASDLADSIESGSGAALTRLTRWADRNREELALSPKN